MMMKTRSSLWKRVPNYLNSRIDRTTAIVEVVTKGEVGMVEEAGPEVDMVAVATVVAAVGITVIEAVTAAVAEATTATEEAIRIEAEEEVEAVTEEEADMAANQEEEGLIIEEVEEADIEADVVAIKEVVMRTNEEQIHLLKNVNVIYRCR
jgi:hypothetical protein